MNEIWFDNQIVATSSSEHEHTSFIASLDIGTYDEYILRNFIILFTAVTQPHLLADIYGDLQAWTVSSLIPFYAFAQILRLISIHLLCNEHLQWLLRAN